MVGEEVTTRWSLRVSLLQNCDDCVTKFASHKALISIVTGRLTFDERGVVHRVEGALVNSVATAQVVGTQVIAEVSLHFVPRFSVTSVQ